MLNRQTEDFSLASPAPRRKQPLPVQFVDLLIIELSNWRWGWRNMVIIGMVFPLLSMMLLAVSPATWAATPWPTSLPATWCWRCSSSMGAS